MGKRSSKAQNTSSQFGSCPSFCLHDTGDSDGHLLGSMCLKFVRLGENLGGAGPCPPQGQGDATATDRDDVRMTYMGASAFSYAINSVEPSLPGLKYADSIQTPSSRNGSCWRNSQYTGNGFTD